MSFKNFRLSFSFFSVLLLLYGCNSGFKYDKSENSITVHQDMFTTEITVVDDAIIHVKKQLPDVPAREMPDFVTVLEPQLVDWKVLMGKDKLSIETSKLTVSISAQGEITYCSGAGEQLLSETNEGTFINPDHEAGYRVAQVFNAGDEGLYGLGQFQSDRMNWKNVPVRLEQFNQEIAVPVLISTNQYGLYWNNYSITDFNLPENEIEFTEVLDERLKIRKTTFTPEKSGNYNFFVLSLTPYSDPKSGKGSTDHLTKSSNQLNKNRQWGPVLVTIDGDTVIHYDTMWYPDSYSGEASLKAGQSYEIIFQNTDEQVPGRLLFNEPDLNKTSFTSLEGEAIDYYFIHGEDPVEVLSEYTRLTGYAPMFPKKAYGFWHCRETFRTQEELLTTARGYRSRNIPIDIMVMDWFFWPDLKGPTWDRSRFPDPKAMVDELLDLNYGAMSTVWPELPHKGIARKFGMEDSYMKGNSYIDFYDFSNHEKFYRMVSDSMLVYGFDAIWYDGSEPIRHPDPEHRTDFGTFRELANTYSLLMSKAVYEGMRKEYKDSVRVYNKTRSAFAGQQRYGNYLWSGDVAANWEQFRDQITAGTNFTMTGNPYWTTDIGAFFRDHVSKNNYFDNQYTNPEYKELLTRWFQFGTFNPIFRIHGYKSNTEVWNYGKEFENVARKFLDVRYTLMPYIYSEAWQVTREGKALMSPMAYYYPHDKSVWNIKYQFMFGKSMMICPVTEYKARERQVYLPEGNWYDYWTNELISGGKEITSAADLKSLPVFVKEGSIIPTGPKLQYATQPSEKPLLLKVYPGKDAFYTLYFDDNRTYNYEKGEYSEILIFYSEADKTITLERGNGDYIDFARAPEDFVIQVVGKDVNIKVKFDGNPVETQLK